MRKISEVIDYVLNLVHDIKTTGSIIGIEKKISDYVKQDKIPYTGMLHKQENILKDLEKISHSPYSYITKEFKEYLEQYPVIIGDGNPGSHVDISEAAMNNGFVFMLGLVTTVLIDS